MSERGDDRVRDDLDHQRALEALQRVVEERASAVVKKNLFVRQGFLKNSVAEIERIRTVTRQGSSLRQVDSPNDARSHA